MIARVSIPLRSGIERSSRTTSHGSLRICFSASALDSASPTTLRSSVSSMICRRPRRRMAWSSAMRTRIEPSLGTLDVRGDAGTARDPHRHARAARPRSLDAHGAAELLGALLHTAQAKRSRLQAIRRGNPCAVVGHGELDFAFLAFEADFHVARASVLRDIGERFAEDAEK